MGACTLCHAAPLLLMCATPEDALVCGVALGAACANRKHREGTRMQVCARHLALMNQWIDTLAQYFAEDA